MSPSDWPHWLRETLPGWAILGILVWFGVQRLLDRDEPVAPGAATIVHRRPVRDWRLLCQTVAFGVLGVCMAINGPLSKSIDMHLTHATQLGLAAILVPAAVFTLLSAFIKSEWWSVGFELIGCALFAGVFAVYAAGYISSASHWLPTLSGLYVCALVIGNLLRALELLRQVK